MTPVSIFITFAVYTLLLFIISGITSRKSGNDAFFLGNRKSPWYVVAYGMIGASLSGVTFISIPGDVGNTQFTYLVIVAGYLIGYAVIAQILIPLYYRLKLTSIYTYLEDRFGKASYKSGAFYFILSRIIGASFRLFLVINVLQAFVFDAWNIPFVATAAFFIILILLYTFRAGIRTIVWTDTLQTTFMLLAVVFTVVFISKDLGWGIRELMNEVFRSDYSKIIETDFKAKHFFIKDFLSGAFIAIVMTGLDQDMMQKNLSCKNVKDAKKNIYALSISLVPVNFLFLSLGAILYIFSLNKGIVLPAGTDNLFPEVALNHLQPIAGIMFIIGLIAAAYSSADSALTALTTSVSVDFVGIPKMKIEDKKKVRLRKIIHMSVAFTLLIVVTIFGMTGDKSVISRLFTLAGYTYGPLLGMFAFGLITKRKVKDVFVPIVVILSPIICILLSTYSEQLFNGYSFGFELLLVNGFLTFMGLLIISTPLKNGRP